MATRTLDYRDGAVNLKGYLATPDGAGARPGIMLFPEAFGIDAHVMERADFHRHVGVENICENIGDAITRAEHVHATRERHTA